MSHSGRSRPSGQTVHHVDPTCSTLDEQVDAKINALYAEIRNLCESRNLQCSATRKLPAEVLSMVFRELSADDQNQRHSPSWAYVTHVCRAWRCAALSQPTLWNNTAGLSRRWLKLSLSRAAAVPLKVVYSHSKDILSLHDSSCSDSSSESSSSSSSSSPVSHVNDILEGIFDTPERLGDLTLSDGSAHVIDRISKPAPFLSALSLRGNFSVPLNFLGNNAPLLRSFISLGCTFPTEVAWLRNLRVLVLLGRWGFRDIGGNAIPITTASFLNVISPLEKLEHLKVHFRPHPIMETAHQDYMGGLICLPRLHTSHFSFLDESSHLVNLFTHLRLPSIHSLHVVWPHRLSHENANKLFASFVVNCCLPFRHLVWTSAEITLYFDLASGGPAFTFRHMSLSSSEELPFQNSEAIEELDICESRALLSLLAAPTSPVPYPSLKQLSLDSTVLQPGHLPHNPEERNPKYITNLLKRWLKKRKAPHNLTRLIISGSQFVTDEDIQALEKFVAVTWIRDKLSQ